MEFPRRLIIATLSGSCLLFLLLAFSACDKSPDPALHVIEPPPEAAADLSAEPQAARPARLANDVHTHLSPLSYPAAISFMDANGLHRVVNMSGGHGPDYTARNLRHADTYDGRIALYFNIDWDGVNDPDFGPRRGQELLDAIDMGYAGLKISKGLGLGVRDADDELLRVDDLRLDPIWQAAGRRGAVVAIHTSDPKAFFEPPGPQNERHAELGAAPSWSFYGEEWPSRDELLAARDAMIARNPDTTFMLLHFANNPEDIDYVDALLKEHPNLIIDVAARVGEFGRHDPQKVRRFFIEHQDRILFATDIMLTVRPHQGQMAYSLTLGSLSETPPTFDDIKPFYDLHWRYFESNEAAIAHPVPIQGDWPVHPISLAPEVLEKLYYKNAERLIFAPWLGRRAAGRVADLARLVSARAQ